ncbi:hypothetical protein [Devosia marina]|uniref:Uncharacterized protein n=1 Tax=Devosia marina TaxID=2683198 RepID=A0A7X3FR72_9HYPH|nr:hypothetical protein [Devosia marina]MVS99264.1 hypothetical protein [Devosia marina]
MVRVPNSISLRFLGSEIKDDAGEFSPLPLHVMPDKECSQFIRRCAAALQSHSTDFHAGHDKENALGAFETTMALLLEVRDIYPGKRADIDAILARFGYPVPEN